MIEQEQLDLLLNGELNAIFENFCNVVAYTLIGLLIFVLGFIIYAGVRDGIKYFGKYKDP